MLSLHKDMLFEILHYLSDQDLYNACQANKTFSELCKDDQFWEARAKLKYPKETIELKKLHNYKDYKTIYRWAPILFLKNLFPKQLGQKSLEKIYHLQELDLSNNQLTTIPRELENLKELKYLYLYENPLKFIPDNIPCIRIYK